MGDLPFDFDAGACGTFNLNFFPVETVFMCFDDTKSNTCHTYVFQENSNIFLTEGIKDCEHKSSGMMEKSSHKFLRRASTTG